MKCLKTKKKEANKINILSSIKLRVCVCVCLHAIAGIRKPEDSLGQSAYSFHHVGSGD